MKSEIIDYKKIDWANIVQQSSQYCILFLSQDQAVVKNEHVFRLNISVMLSFKLSLKTVTQDDRNELMSTIRKR